MQFSIDRFEENFAVVELPDGTFANVPRTILPAEAKEGSVIKLTIDCDEEAARRAKILELTKKVWKD